jgi:hypothetical protein
MKLTKPKPGARAGSRIKAPEDMTRLAERLDPSCGR